MHLMHESQLAMHQSQLAMHESQLAMHYLYLTSTQYERANIY